MVPAPRPKFEIWVYSPRLEAVHLRFGAVARGGLRWSERPEDFRTEVLGLVKAQEVKNSVIVPSGAKGGFVCKRLPDPADRDAYQAEVLACYRTFISAMLDVTDNIVGDAVVPPPGVVRLDGDDPYLVVAADKGTATFSDVANEIAGAVRVLARRRVRLGRLRGLRPQEDGHHRPRRLGVGALALRGAAAQPRYRRLHGRRHRRHVRRRVRQRDAAVAAHEAGRGVRPPARVPRPGPGPGGQLRRAAAAVRPAPLVVGRLRHVADLRRRRRLAPVGEVGADLRAGPRGARPRRRRSPRSRPTS